MTLKRLFDLICATAGLVVLAPLFTLVGILIKLDASGPVFFKQSRVGRYGAAFDIYKFRTMVVDSEKLGAQVTSGDDPRITRIGFLLRKYKIDELPQLINVFIGQMSLVGPRPEVPRYVGKFSKEYEKILSVRPGITDFASLEYLDENDLLSGCDDPESLYIQTILPEKIKYYEKYLSEQSFATDLRIIFRTICALIR